MPCIVLQICNQFRNTDPAKKGFFERRKYQKYPETEVAVPSNVPKIFKIHSKYFGRGSVRLPPGALLTFTLMDWCSGWA